MVEGLRRHAQSHRHTVFRWNGPGRQHFSGGNPLVWARFDSPSSMSNWQAFGNHFEARPRGASLKDLALRAVDVAG
jgi:hypothetical protein